MPNLRVTSKTALATSYLRSEEALRGMSVFVATTEPLEASDQVQTARLPLEQTSTAHYPDGRKNPSRECVVSSNKPLSSEYESLTEISETKHSDTEASKRQRQKSSGTSSNTMFHEHELTG